MSTASTKSPTTLDEQVASICQAGSIVAVTRIKQVLTNKEGYGPDQVRIILETAQAHEVRAKTQRPAVRQALRNALKKLPQETPLTPPSKRAKPITTEVVAPKEAILLDASKSLEKLRKIVVGHEEKFNAATLGPRLQIGLQCLKAHHAFAIPADKNKRGGRPSKNPVTRDAVSPEGFEGWLASQAQWLKKPTAYKYMTAVRGLALDHEATEKQVAAALKLKLRKGPVTIKSLCDEALEAFGPDDTGDNSGNQQTEFEFLKSSCSAFRKEVDALVALKSELDAYPDFKRVATARLYSALHDLTGTHWKPSDEPDALASVDPDAISI
jgi:hypothetical protein